MNGQWIWENEEAAPDEYADFCASFPAGARTELRISADSRYAVWVNGSLAAWGQYADYPHYKVFDAVDISPFCRPGENEIRITVWYHGTPSSVYCPGQAGVWFEIDADGVTVCVSGEETLCRRNPNYVSHRKKRITNQLGYGFAYSAVGCGENIMWHPAVCTGYGAELHPRPVEKLVLQPQRTASVIGGDGRTHFLLDMGEEEVGFLTLSLHSDAAQTITVAYGEHILDGGVRRIIGERDFSVEYTAAPGENEYLNPFLRLGCRYLELFCESPVTLYRVGLCPTVYPLTEIPYRAPDKRMQEIYDVCVRTLRLCMHEHYEDCPWREQALYTMDSRNQMLAGYYAFGEKRFPRACLALMAQDRREDGLLAITYPCGVDRTIPSFSLHYFTAVLEYVRHSGDTSLVHEVWPRMMQILSVFRERIRDGVLWSFEGRQHWNFYEWSDGLAGTLGRSQASRPELILTCLAIRAFEAARALADLAEIPYDGGDEAPRLREGVRRVFLLPEGVFSDFADVRHVSELGNALAILSGVTDDEERGRLAQRLASRTLDAVPITLSMKCFLYDALLDADTERYTPWILGDIHEVFGRMLDAGATSVWETEGGAEDFGGAGSLCHGWSAMPVYYFHLLCGGEAGARGESF